MPSVSISISPPNPPKPSSDYSKSSSLQDVADRFIDRKMDYLTSLRPQIQNALIFLRKFHTIRSLDVVFITDDDIEDGEQKQQKGGFRYGFLPSLINWKTKFDFKLQSFVFLFAQSVHTEKEADSVTSLADVTDEEELELRLYSAFHGVVDSIEWGNVMSCLLVQHPMLRDVTIAGSSKGGKICLTNKSIVDLRNSLSPEDVARINGNGIGVTINVKSAYIPGLRLPKTGYVMSSVSLVVVRVGRRLYQPGGDDGFRTEDSDDTDSSDEDDDYGYGHGHGHGHIEYGDDSDILDWDFESDEEVFREAVTSILIHHKDKMKRET
ncbi:hypothetical protein SSX86_013574 [Deinandra increscens subsp. villosa]|uniref:Uncharacterized protein n=1 Tax=Deinandra increscens subsp. villosa TaxID=3103831 RepID=A0AAP0GWU3_9ASTR